MLAEALGPPFQEFGFETRIRDTHPLIAPKLRRLALA
jgi:hypothetical protein